MQLPLAAIFFMTYIYRAGGMAPSTPPDPLLLWLRSYWVETTLIYNEQYQYSVILVLYGFQISRCGNQSQRNCTVGLERSVSFTVRPREFQNRIWRGCAWATSWRMTNWYVYSLNIWLFLLMPSINVCYRFKQCPTEWRWGSHWAEGWTKPTILSRMRQRKMRVITSVEPRTRWGSMKLMPLLLSWVRFDIISDC